MFFYEIELKSKRKVQATFAGDGDLRPMNDKTSGQQWQAVLFSYKMKRKCNKNGKNWMAGKLCRRCCCYLYLSNQIWTLNIYGQQGKTFKKIKFEETKLVFYAKQKNVFSGYRMTIVEGFI